MAHVTADRVKETTAVTGTGPANLLGAVSGYRSFNSQLSIGDTCAYAIVSATGLEWEVGIGTYSAVNTLTRTTVQSSTNSNAAVNFGAGTKDVFVCPTAGSLLDYDPVTHKISDATTIDFNDGSATALAAGRMWYNGSTGSWNLGMGGGNITQQVGEEIFVYGKASAAITDSPLQIIYQTGTVGASGVITFGPTIAGITNGDLIIGVATEPIAHNGFGRVTSFGVVHNITTNGTAYGETWADGDMIYYNPVTGNPTNIKPVAPNIKVSVGTLIKAGAGGSGSIQVEINHGSVLGGTDSNVQITSPVDGQILKYDGVAQVWENAAASVDLATGVTGILPVANGGTGVTTSTGSGSVVLSTTPTLVTPKTNSIAAVPVVSGAGNSLTLAGGSGVGTGAGGNLILSAGAQATSGGDGNIRFTNSSNTNYAAINAGFTQQINFYANTILSFTISSYIPQRGYIGAPSTGGFAWADNATGDFSNHGDLYLSRDAANTLAQRNGTNPQSFRVYNTYTDASNYERLGITWASNICTIGPESAGTGTARRLRLNFGDSTNTNIQSTGTNNLLLYTGGLAFLTSTSGSVAFRTFYAGGTVSGITFGQGNGGNANRVGDSYVFRLTGGSGTADPGYIGFGGAFSPVGAISTTQHTQEDGFLLKMLATATPIVAFGSSFASTVPAIKRSGTQLQIRLADDSADASFSASYVKTPALTVATLPSASTAGMGSRAFVSDANATTFASIVAGGGSNKVPVYSDGTNWLIG